MVNRLKLALRVYFHDLELLPDGSYRSVLVKTSITRGKRDALILEEREKEAAAKAAAAEAPQPAQLPAAE